MFIIYVFVCIFFVWRFVATETDVIHYVFLSNKVSVLFCSVLSGLTTSELKLNFFNHLPWRASEPKILLARKIFYCPTIFMQITSHF